MRNTITLAKKNEFLALMQSEKVKERIMSVLPNCDENLLVGFINRVMTEAKRNPKIMSCTPSSIIDACITAAQLNLMPDSLLGLCYFIPRRDVLTVMVGYKGLLKLAYRSVKGLQHVEAHAVYQGEDFECQMGSKINIFHMINLVTQKRSDPKNITGVYAILTYENGNKIYEVMTKEEVDLIKARSQAAKSGFSPWTTDYVAMAKKTVIKRILKTCDCSSEDIMKAISVDDEQEYKYSRSVVATVKAEKIFTEDDVKTDFLNISAVKEDAPNAKEFFDE